MSVVLDQHWRASALSRLCAERNVDAELATSEQGHPLLRTAFRADLAALAAGWLRGAVKAAPAGYRPDGAVLRVWVLAAGRRADNGYLLGLDPHAPETHPELAGALAAIGLPGSIVGMRAGGPALRITGRRRTARLLELVGDPPAEAEPDHWPGISRP